MIPLCMTDRIDEARYGTDLRDARPGTGAQLAAGARPPRVCEKRTCVIAKRVEQSRFEIVAI